MEHVDTCVIGAGVVGLAIGRALALAGAETMVLDREFEFGQGVSSRNSEVIHAGIYYPKDSLKARFCVEGKHQLYEYCERHHVPHARLGKLIVATCEDEEAVLEEIRRKAADNGVEDLEFWNGTRLGKEEPAVRATRALFSPSTGIVSCHDLMQAYLGDLDNAGGLFVGGTNIERVHREADHFVLVCDAGGEEYRLSTRRLVNAAGLGAQKLAAACDFLDPAFVPPLYYGKGNYFTLAGKSPFQRLIYPVPEPSGAGLGVHATLDLGGQVKFGPDVQYVDGENYRVDADRKGPFAEAVRRYFPALDTEALEPGYVGIRPKLAPPGEAPADFVVQDHAVHGVAGLVNLYGIESPGLTSSLAIADHVERRLAELEA
ncbi:MAG: NAD(P)/FAD-dependent oxidoreductase [Gammaproteobacteria bacterium]|nr:NAD(P)/FAD-dependent oxidoreductase [Gammaproteobacteria bacterium]